MCYQTRQIRTVKDLEIKYKVGLSNPSYRDLFDQPSYHLNGFAHPNMLLIPQQKSKVLAPGVWGLVPDNKKPDQIQSYYKKSVRYGSGLNAQSEKLFNHFMYSKVAYTQRCIIPVTGFFEPHAHLKKKYPIFIHRADDAIFSLAGIYTIIGSHVTFAILTKAATPFFAKIHNEKKRQPVILDAEGENNWLSQELRQDELLYFLQKDYPVSELEAFPVSRNLYKRAIDSNVASITDRVDYDELGDLNFN